MGSLGLAPSADIGDGCAVFQPCHGTAPDLAGQGLANPLAMILSGAMMLDWLGHEQGDAKLTAAGAAIEAAVTKIVVARTALTADLGGSVTTTACAAAVREALVAT